VTCQPDHRPIDKTKRPPVIKELRGAFQHFVNEDRLTAIIYYNWTALRGYESQAIFRCGALTDFGKLALKPM
jgi:hypothetical protein